MPELTSFIREETPTRVLAPIQIRKISGENLWLLEEEDQELGRLQLTSGWFTCGHRYIYTAGEDVWDIRSGFTESRYAIESILAETPVQASATPWYPPDENCEEVPGTLSLEGRELTFRDAGLRFQIAQQDEVWFEVSRPWRDSLLKRQVMCEIWPSAAFVPQEHLLALIMPALLLRSGL